MPTNLPELKADIFDGRTADSNCLDRLMEVLEKLIERLSTLHLEMQTGNKLKKNLLGYPDCTPTTKSMNSNRLQS